MDVKAEKRRKSEINLEKFFFFLFLVSLFLLEEYFRTIKSANEFLK